jgi:hypothetical protein
MQNRRWGIAAAALFLLAQAVGLAQGARALTLADLAGGGSFSAGLLTFDDFEITVVGDLSPQLEDYAVQVLGDGFRVSGPLSAVSGDSGTLLVSYQVTAPADLIEGAALFAPGIAIGSGSQAWVGESLLDGADVLGSLFVFDIAGVGSSPADSVGFAPVSHVEVAKSVHLGSGLFAALTVVDQRFFVAPEPLTLLLLVVGLLGLAASGRQRSASG